MDIYFFGIIKGGKGFYLEEKMEGRDFSERKRVQRRFWGKIGGKVLFWENNWGEHTFFGKLSTTFN